MRESPAVELMELLVARGAKVSVRTRTCRCFRACASPLAESVPLDATTIAGYDLIAGHRPRAFDYAGEKTRLIVDTRSEYLEPAPNVVKA